MGSGKISLGRPEAERLQHRFICRSTSNASRDPPSQDANISQSPATAAETYVTAASIASSSAPAAFASRISAPSLARAAGKVTVADIIIAVDEPLDATQCGGKENCHGAHTDGARCMTHELWTTLNEKMVDYLDSVSLQDLVDQQRQKEQNVVHVHRGAPAAVGHN